MKYTYVTVPDKAIREILHQFILDALETEDAEAALGFYARKSGVKRGIEVDAVGYAVHELMFSLVGAVNKQGPEKVLKTLEQMMKDE